MRLAGEQGFRDFLCLPPVKENRTQPADPPSPACLILGYTVAHKEIAMYEALASTAAAAGDLQTGQLTRDIQKQEQYAAEMIWSLIAPSVQKSYGKISEAA